MLGKIKMQLEGVYTKEHLEELEQVEQLSYMEHFTSADAYMIGSSIVNGAKKINGNIVVFITNEENQALMYQYVGEKMTQRNIDFAMKKRNAVLKSGHNSLWPMVKELVDGDQTDIFDDNSDCLPVGGAFPIFINTKMVATITVSGLHDGMDFKVIVQALAYYHHIEAPQFHGKCI